MLIDELLSQLASGHCSEVFASGTAAIVSPIGLLSDPHGAPARDYEPRDVGKVAGELRAALLAIQERRAPDPFGWVREVPPL
jgi:branched-chain amino acid aminotransferase